MFDHNTIARSKVFKGETFVPTLCLVTYDFVFDAMTFIFQALFKTFTPGGSFSHTSQSPTHLFERKVLSSLDMI